MKCQCGLEAVFSCSCKETVTFFCDNCVMTHLKDKSLQHSLLTIPQVPTSKQVVISTLLKGLAEIRSVEKKITNDLEILIKQLENEAKTVFKILNSAKENIEDILIGLYNSSEISNLPILCDTLQLDAKSAENKCSNWELITECVLTRQVGIMINEWLLIENKVFSCMGREEIESNNLICQNGHGLIWSDVALFENFLNHKEIWIECGKCHDIFSTSCWHCKICAFSLCENCGNQQGHASPKLKCSNQHDLLIKFDLDIFYNTQDNSIFSCAMCQITQFASGWHCRLCKYQYCLKCAVSLNVKPYQPSIKCQQNHELVLTLVKMPEIKKSSKKNSILGYFENKKHKKNSKKEALLMNCKLCLVNVVGKSSFACEPCKCFVCENCVNFEIKPISPHPAISCPDHHLMQWYTFMGFICNMCMISQLGPRYRCRLCDFDICYKCSNKLELIFRNNLSAKFACQHTIQYTFIDNYSQTVFCKSCGLSNQNFAIKIFICEQCDCYFCIDCYYSYCSPLNN